MKEVNKESVTILSLSENEFQDLLTVFEIAQDSYGLWGSLSDLHNKLLEIGDSLNERSK